MMNINEADAMGFTPLILAVLTYLLVRMLSITVSASYFLYNIKVNYKNKKLNLKYFNTYIIYFIIWLDHTVFLPIYATSYK